MAPHETHLKTHKSATGRNTATRRTAVTTPHDARLALALDTALRVVSLAISPLAAALSLLFTAHRTPSAPALGLTRAAWLDVACSARLYRHISPGSLPLLSRHSPGALSRTRRRRATAALRCVALRCVAAVIGAQGPSRSKKKCRLPTKKRCAPPTVPRRCTRGFQRSVQQKCSEEEPRCTRCSIESVLKALFPKGNTLITRRAVLIENTLFLKSCSPREHAVPQESRPQIAQEK